MNGELTIVAVFMAGILSFLSPCVLPLVPPYLCFLAGASLEELTEVARGPTSVFGFSPLSTLLHRMQASDIVVKDDRITRIVDDYCRTPFAGLSTVLCRSERLEVDKRFLQRTVLQLGAAALLLDHGQTRLLEETVAASPLERLLYVDGC